MKNEINYLRIAMDESNGLFAWHMFGVINAVHLGQSIPDSPDTIAREYLEVFHADALAEAQNNSEKVLDASV